MFYDNSVIENIRQSSNIVEIVSMYVSLTKKGTSYMGCCPFHNEKTASFFVNEDKGLYHCFGCGAGGNVISFIMRIENFQFIEAVKFLAEKANITLPEANMTEKMEKELKEKKRLYDINRETANYYYKLLKSSNGKTAREYLEKRGLSEETRKKFGIGYSAPMRDNLLKYLKTKNFREADIEKVGLILKNSRGYYDRFFDRVMFPILDVHNNVIGFGGRIMQGDGPKYLNSPETVIFSKRTNLYAMNIARKTKREDIIIAEGYMDVISMHQAGYDNVVASLGTALTSEQAKLIRKYKRDAIIIYDSDEAGIKATFRAIPILKNNGLNVRVLTIKDAKDPDEYISKHGSEKFEELINTSVSYIEYELDVLKNKYDITNMNFKKKFINEVIELIKEIKDEVDVELYLEKLSEVVSISKDLLRNELKSDKKIKKQEEVPQKKVPKADSKEMQLISIMLKKRKYFEFVLKYLNEMDFEDDFLRNLVILIKNHYETDNTLVLASVLNTFESLEDQNSIVELSALCPEIGDADIMKILEKLIKDKMNEKIDKRIEELKIKIQAETVDEKLKLLADEISMKTKEKHMLNKLNLQGDDK